MTINEEKKKLMLDLENQAVQHEGKARELRAARQQVKLELAEDIKTEVAEKSLAAQETAAANAAKSAESCEAARSDLGTFLTTAESVLKRIEAAQAKVELEAAQLKPAKLDEEFDGG